jgi:hypothetical protein
MNRKIIKITSKISSIDKITDTDKYNNILEEINKISSKIYESQELILNKLNSLEGRINIIEQKIESKSSNNKTIIENLKELKREDLDIVQEEVLKALLYRDHRSIIYLFRHVYRNKMNETNIYPIKLSGKRSVEYYNNSKWNSDLYGHHSMNIICKNFENLFIKYNNLDNIDSNNFMLNQDFIYKLSQEKYIKSIFKNIIEEIRTSC